MSTDTPDTANVVQPQHRLVDQGAREQVLTLDAADAGRRVLLFATTKAGR